MSEEGGGGEGFNRAQRIGLVAGPAAFLLMLLLPPPGGLEPAAWRTAAVVVLMALWWMTEAIPIPITALLPLALFPLFGILSMPEAAAPYANEVIFLFMGGFMLGMAMERWGLHRRLALQIMSWTGTAPTRLVLGFMLATGFISMWISNTATAAMMLPMAVAVGELFRPKGVGTGPGAPPFNFGICLMLGVAYAASIGGIGTLIGTPPNAVFAAAASELLGVQIGFLQWMAVGVPLVVVMLPLTWLLLVRVLYPPGELEGDAAALLAAERERLGPMSLGEKVVGVVFLLTAIAWIFREPKAFGAFTLPGLATFAPRVVDSTIAIIAAVVLFLIPIDWRAGTFALEWRQARNMPWGVLTLFGGGLSMARAMDQTGLASWFGQLVGGLGDVSPIVVVLAVATLFIFLTEITSNTAVATMAMPIMVAAAAGTGLEPILLMSCAALGASMAFMLPVATPPNAIVFASGYLTIPQMAKAGFWLNIISIGLVTGAVMLLVPRFLVP